jgi:uncharacterized protein YkwD
MAVRLVLACVALSVLLPSEALASSMARSAERTMVEAVNEARRDHGRPALVESAALARSAGRLAVTLTRLDVFGHVGGAPAGVRGEALAMHRGWRARPSSTVRRWLRSPAHRAVVLGPCRAVGAGIRRARLGGRLATVWVLHVGAP